jgi:hypothetical protein
MTGSAAATLVAGYRSWWPLPADGAPNRGHGYDAGGDPFPASYAGG